MIAAVTRTGLGLLTCLLAAVSPVQARLWIVGPDGDFETPGQAARKVGDGDEVRIRSGTYVNDVAVWKRKDLKIVGEGAVILYSERVAEGKGIWVLKGDNIRIRNITFAGARARDRNGAGLRIVRGSVQVEHCVFQNNENGILTGHDADSTIVVRHSSFIANGHGDGYSHNLYAGRVGRLVVEYNAFLGVRTGHHIKSRARESLIRYNFIEDGEASSSYMLDFPHGGVVHVLGNLIHRNAIAQNHVLISYGTASRLYPGGELLLKENRFLIEDRSARVVRIGDPARKQGIRSRMVDNRIVKGAP